jgi:hypothetical protein
LRMADEHWIRRFRSWYAALLRLYPRRYRERFGEPMEQTFNDLLRERAEKGKGVFGFALWMFVETFAATMRENKSLLRIALATAFILLLPLLAMQFTDEVVWDLADFAVAGTLLLGAGLTYELMARKAGHIAYRAAVGVAVAAALLLVWMNLAVGIIGNEENPANLMYIGVLAVGIIGALIARFQPQGMARALFATALAQMLVALIAQIAGLGFTFMLNGLFATLWVVSSLLFRRAGASDPT